MICDFDTIESPQAPGLADEFDLKAHSMWLLRRGQPYRQMIFFEHGPTRCPVLIVAKVAAAAFDSWAQWLTRKQQAAGIRYARQAELQVLWKLAYVYCSTSMAEEVFLCHPAICAMLGEEIRGHFETTKNGRGNHD